MTRNKNHPARSHAFLSRLHDGDLAPSERAHFEAHRAHCAECRTAAAEYERALSLFRSARSSPPPADMASRVLRKVQAVAGPRRPAGASLFSIDWRWAGAFAAVLLVLLVGAPIALRQQRVSPADEGPITVALDQGSAAPPAGPPPGKTQEEAQRNAPGRAVPQASRKLSAPPPASFAEEPKAAANDSRSVSGYYDSAAPAKPQPLAQAPVARLEAAAAAPPQTTTASSAAGSNALQFQTNDSARQQGKVGPRAGTPLPASQPAQAQERSGGEGAREPAFVAGDTPVLDRPSRLLVQPLDAQGSAPELEARPEEPDLTELRGRSFVLVVDASGRVRDVRETAKKEPGADGTRRDAALAKEKDNAADPLKGLRFKPGERPRRLLLRVE